MKRVLLPLCIALLLSGCSRVWHTSDLQVANYKVDQGATQEAADITAMIAPYKQQLDAEMNLVIGQLANSLKKTKPESNMGNWVADMIHKKSEDYYQKPIDFAIVNYGGLRIPSLAAGELQARHIFELMPFDNQLVVLKVDGTIVQKLFTRMAEYGGWPISHQVRFRIVDKQAKDILINGQPIQANRNYTIALSDFIANGGDNCFFFRDQPRDQLSVLFRDAMIEFVKEETAAGRQLSAKIDGRVK